MSYDSLPSDEIINKTVEALKKRKINAEVVADAAAALARVKEMIPASADVMTGSSKTLDHLRLTDLLKSGASGWVNWKEKIVTETDQAKQMQLRKESSSAGYFLLSAHALTEDGVLMHASASGSQLPALAMLSPHVIMVVGIQKIVSTEAEAVKRLHEYVFPLEDERMKATGAPGSVINKVLFTYGEMFGRLTVILVKEKLGF